MIIKKLLIALIVVVVLLLTAAAFSHRILPADMDECQRDVTHLGHVHELPPFHCIGHSERNRETGKWDHVHPWMTDEWRREHGLQSQ